MFINKYLNIFGSLVFSLQLMTAPAGAQRFSFAAMGDTPCNLPGDFDRFGRLIERINGGFDPIGCMAKLRDMLFPNPAQSLGREKLTLAHQGMDAAHKAYIENRRWERAGVVFATLHIVGSNNNLQLTTKQR